jgi:hypothetical protein
MSVASSPDGTRLVSGSMDKTLRLWEPVALSASHAHTLGKVTAGEQIPIVTFFREPTFPQNFLADLVSVHMLQATSSPTRRHSR